MDEKTYKITRLFIKYYQNTLDTSEKAKLDAWLEEDKRNQKLLQVHGSFSKLVQDMRFYGETDMEKGYEGVSRKVGRRHERKRYRTRWMVWGGVAASLIILITFGTLWWGSSSGREEFVIALAAPDRLGVQLELSNGERIPLASKFKIKESDGTNVATNDSTSIVYQNDEGCAMPEEELVYNTVITPRGTEYLVTLPDGSNVWLNSDSRLKFPVKFSKATRRVELVGEGYFEVKRDASSPFIVNSGKLEVLVTGTSFNITAYPDEKIVQATLVSGSVHVSCPGNSGIKDESLQPNEIAVFLQGSQTIEKRKVDITPYVAWHEGYLYFHDENLGSIAKKLERWYNISFEFDQPETKELVFYGSVKRHENIVQVLNMLRCTNLINFTIIDSKTVRVTRL